jgi:hypothetical protein
MEKGLVQRWMDVCKPFNLVNIKKQYAEAYVKSVGLDQETSAKVKAALESMDEGAMLELIRTFAEEHFSDDSLRAAITFFESDDGKKYQSERGLVWAHSNALIGKYMGELVRKSFGA